ncbi:MAG TPA: ergothioneine biosynthesis protein EgtB [Xanthomonadales bacterium]|nr:ergothioneine biosynthesis protein EgtB [Xanthomonadales bacterium]
MITTPETLAGDALLERYMGVRRDTLALAEPLSPEDMTVQSMPDASPTRWHLAHTTWFFEHFLLSRERGHRPYREGWDYLFNSYYYTVGDMHQRPRRGLLSRPGTDEILAWRAHVDQRMARLIEGAGEDPETAFLVNLGLNHEQQHQELILTDIKHALSLNPLKPTYRDDIDLAPASQTELDFHAHPGGITEIGAQGPEFCFDNETPRHRELLNPFELASRPVSNGDYREFIDDDGYQRPELWLSDGWATIVQQSWQRPVYWSEGLDSEFSLLGEIELDPHRPACHLSYFEADAYARWAGARLPSEAEWETVAAQQPAAGPQNDKQNCHPGATQPGALDLGQVWEWTRSSYSAYPGFKPLAGSLGEYNGKFMSGQMVLRGGSCATPPGHARPSYRNFFYPQARWQFSGLRLATDA